MWGQLPAQFIGGAGFPPDWAERAVDVVWNGIATRSSS